MLMEHLRELFDAGAASRGGAGPAPELVLPESAGDRSQSRLEELAQELFSLLDDDGDGALDQPALVRMNRRLALLHQAHQGQDTPPPAPMQDPASVYPNFREHLLQVLSAYDHSLEAQEDLLAHLITLERHGEDARPALVSRGAQGPRWLGLDLCAHPGAAAQEYAPAVLENAKALGSRAVSASKATSRSVSLRANRLATRAAPRLRALADSARSASTSAASRATSTVGDWLATARDGLQLQGCLSSSPRCRRQPCLRLELCPKTEKADAAQPRLSARGAESSQLELAPRQAEAALVPPAAPRPLPPAPRPAPVLRAPGEVLERRTQRHEVEAAGEQREERQPAAAKRRIPEAERRLAAWRCEPEDGLHIDVRSLPDVGGPRTSSRLRAGEVFQVSEERMGADGVLYLRLADGTGWVFDRKPGVGTLCARVGPLPVEEAPMQRAAVPPPLQLEEESGMPAPAARTEAPASARGTLGASSGATEDQCFWQLAGPFQSQAGSQPLLQMATQFAAQTAKDHNPSFVHWPRSSSARLSSSMSMRYGGA